MFFIFARLVTVLLFLLLCVVGCMEIELVDVGKSKSVVAVDGVVDDLDRVSTISRYRRGIGFWPDAIVDAGVEFAELGVVP